MLSVLVVLITFLLLFPFPCSFPFSLLLLVLLGESLFKKEIHFEKVGMCKLGMSDLDGERWGREEVCGRE